MNILYIHGFGSKFDRNHEKVQALEKLGEVKGINLDYTVGFNHCFKEVMVFVEENDIELIIGTSLGGHMAAQVGAKCGLPFVAVNPSIEPPLTLKKYQGIGTDHTGRTYNLTPEKINEYPLINKTGCGLILLEMGDEVINAVHTKNILTEYYEVDVEPGGNHRYTNLINKINLINQFFNSAELVYDF